MWKLVGWTCTAVLVAGCFWELSRSEPTVPPAAMGALLLGLGLLVGLRLGSDSATIFVKDLLRLNKFLAEQNDQLTELNREHVQQQISQLADATEECEDDA